jgi:hypothetical protein
VSEALPVGVTHETILKQIADGERAHEARIPKYDHAYEVYRGTTSKKSGKQEWESKLQVKYGLQTIDTTLVNVVTDVPRADVKPRRPQDTKTAPLMQRILDYHVDEDHLNESWPLFVWQGLVYPLTVAKVHWLYRESERMGRDFVPNPADPQRPIPIERTERVVLRDGPTFEPWDIYHAWWDPNGRDVDSCKYFVLRSYVTKDDILKNTKSEHNPFGRYDPEAVVQMLKDAPRGAGLQQSALERMKPGTGDKRKGRYEILEVWRDDSCVVLGERRAVLAADPNPFWHGRKPIVAAQTRLDGFELMGIGETELLDDIQQAMWTIEQMMFDNLRMTVHRGFTYRETGVLDPRSLVVKPRFFWPVQDHDDIKPVDMPTLGQDVFRQVDTLLARMQLITGVNSYVSGAETVGVDQNTATGVTALTDIASRLLRFKARMLATKGLQRTFELWGELVQQFMDKQTAVRIEGADGISWQEIGPQEIVGNYDYTVRGVEESLSRQQQRGEVMGLLNALAPFANLNIINWQPILQKVAENFDFPSPDVLFRTPQAPPQASPAPNGMPPPNGNGGAPPQPNMQPSTLQGVQLPPGVSGAILGGGG